MPSASKMPQQAGKWNAIEHPSLAVHPDGKVGKPPASPPPHVGPPPSRPASPPPPSPPVPLAPLVPLVPLLPLDPLVPLLPLEPLVPLEPLLPLEPSPPAPPSSLPLPRNGLDGPPHATPIATMSDTDTTRIPLRTLGAIGPPPTREGSANAPPRGDCRQ